jgi:predicted nucleic acid-binding protein
VGRALILETTFLIDLEREQLRDEPGPAHRFLESHGAERLHVTTVTAGELAAGASAEERPAWKELLGRFRVLSIDRDACWRYGRLLSYLKDNGLLIAANDLWIASIAVSNGLPLATRNERHFRRIPDLRVVGYR